MKRARLLALAVALCVAAPAFADCNTELKATDGYKELSAKLKCLADRIRALEKQSAGPQVATGITAVLPTTKLGAVVAGTAVLPNGCFDAEAGAKFKGTYVFQIADKDTRPLCWKDGSMMLTLLKIADGAITCRKTDGNNFNCNFNRTERFSLAENGQLLITPQKLLVAEGETPKVKVTIEFIAN